MKKYFKNTLFIFPISSIVVTPFIIVSCSTKDDFDFDYKSTQSSLDELAQIMYNSLPNKFFETNYNLKLKDVKESDIKWKYENRFPTIKVIINSIKTWPEKDVSGIKLNNGVDFTFILYDKVKGFTSKGSSKTFWLHGYQNDK